MHKNKWVRKLSAFFDLDQRERTKKKKKLKEILRKLSKNEKKLKEKLREEKSKESQKLLNKQINIVHAQRKKGIKALKDIES